MAGITSACERAWQEGTTGYVVYDKRLRIVEASERDLVGLTWADLPGWPEAFGADVEHVRSHNTSVVVRRLWYRRVWESRYTAAGDGVRVTWRCLLRVPDDAADSISRFLDAGRQVLEALEVDQPGAAYEPVAAQARLRAAGPRLRAV